MTRPAGPRAWRWGWLWGPPILQMIAIFASSSQSRLGPPPGMSDKLAHGIAYAVLAALLLRAMTAADWGRLTVRTAVIAIGIAAVYGALDEWHQSFVPDRTPDWADVWADLTGAFVGAGALWSCGIIKRAFGR